jgi:carbon storage regulator
MQQHSREMDMLVLTRKKGQVVVIGDNIEVKVVAIGPHRVMLGFTAPAGVRIHREELRAALDAPNSAPTSLEEPEPSP